MKFNGSALIYTVKAAYPFLMLKPIRYVFGLFPVPKIQNIWDHLGIAVIRALYSGQGIWGGILAFNYIGPAARAHNLRGDMLGSGFRTRPVNICIDFQQIGKAASRPGGAVLARRRYPETHIITGYTR
jgi:hypothetical protein